jgi:hypothetical protein
MCIWMKAGTEETALKDGHIEFLVLATANRNLDLTKTSSCISVKTSVFTAVKVTVFTSTCLDV